MEHAAATKSSNISELVTRFTRVCRLRSIGVLPSGNPMSQEHLRSCKLNNIDATEVAECDIEKVYPKLFEVPSTSVVCSDLEIQRLFDIVSALKLAYVQLQEAHIPYNPEKIMAADELIVTKLEALCKIKNVHKENRVVKSKSGFSLLCDICARVEAIEKRSEKLKVDIKTKDSEILHLQQKLLNINAVNTELLEKLQKKNLEGRKVKLHGISFFQDIFEAASKAIHDFAKPLISLMKVAGWDLDWAAESIEAAVVYSKRSHKKYAFEAYISRRMFHGISHQPYDVDEIMKFDDPMDALMAFPDSAFANFCQKKYLASVHPNMEASFFGSLDQRTFVISGKHPRTPFYQAFAKMAKWVWVLQGIAASSAGGVQMFSVSRGCLFSDIYMESMEEEREGTGTTNEAAAYKVEFMVMPGFELGDTVVRSKVYLSRSKS